MKIFYHYCQSFINFLKIDVKITSQLSSNNLKGFQFIFMIMLLLNCHDKIKNVRGEKLYSVFLLN